MYNCMLADSCSLDMTYVLLYMYMFIVMMCSCALYFRRHSIQRWTFCDISHVEEGPRRWKRYYSARATVDVRMDEGRPKFDYKVRKC